MASTEPVELRNNEVRALAHYAMCRHCAWQTAPTDSLAHPLERARAHTERTHHTTEACTTHAIVIT